MKPQSQALNNQRNQETNVKIEKVLDQMKEANKELKQVSAKIYDARNPNINIVKTSIEDSNSSFNNNNNSNNTTIISKRKTSKPKSNNSFINTPPKRKISSISKDKKKEEKKIFQRKSSKEKERVNMTKENEVIILDESKEKLINVRKSLHDYLTMKQNKMLCQSPNENIRERFPNNQYVDDIDTNNYKPTPPQNENQHFTKKKEFVKDYKKQVNSFSPVIINEKNFNNQQFVKDHDSKEKTSYNQHEKQFSNDKYKTTSYNQNIDQSYTQNFEIYSNRSHLQINQAYPHKVSSNNNCGNNQAFQDDNIIVNNNSNYHQKMSSLSNNTNLNSNGVSLSYHSLNTGNTSFKSIEKQSNRI